MQIVTRGSKSILLAKVRNTTTEEKARHADVTITAANRRESILLEESVYVSPSASRLYRNNGLVT